MDKVLPRKKNPVKSRGKSGEIFRIRCAEASQDLAGAAGSVVAAGSRVNVLFLVVSIVSDATLLEQ